MWKLWITRLLGTRLCIVVVTGDTYLVRTEHTCRFRQTTMYSWGYGRTFAVHVVASRRLT